MHLQRIFCLSVKCLKWICGGDFFREIAKVHLWVRLFVGPLSHEPSDIFWENRIETDKKFYVSIFVVWSSSLEDSQLQQVMSPSMANMGLAEGCVTVSTSRLSREPMSLWFHVVSSSLSSNAIHSSSRFMKFSVRPFRLEIP